MKLTDEKIIEALDAGKRIIMDGCELEASRDWLRFHNTGYVVLFSLDLIKSDNFEIVEPEIDWDKVIKEKYLCKFWDKDEEPTRENDYTIGFLGSYFAEYDLKFENSCCYSYWKYCRPLRAEEVKLVTNEKELWK